MKLELYHLGRGYYVSNNGKVAGTLDKNRYGEYKRIRELKTTLSNGYPTVYIDIGEGHKKYTVHRLVAKAFIPREDGKDCVDHIDGDKTNNHVSNLRWVTHAENTQYGKTSKLNREQVEEIKRLYKLGYSQRAIADMFGVTQCPIQNIVNGRSWKQSF